VFFPQVEKQKPLLIVKSIHRALPWFTNVVIPFMRTSPRRIDVIDRMGPRSKMAENYGPIKMPMIIDFAEDDRLW